MKDRDLWRSIPAVQHMMIVIKMMRTAPANMADKKLVKMKKEKKMTRKPDNSEEMKLSDSREEIKLSDSKEEMKLSDNKV